jgi:hypothetical protein
VLKEQLVGGTAEDFNQPHKHWELWRLCIVLSSRWVTRLLKVTSSMVLVAAFIRSFTDPRVRHSAMHLPELRTCANRRGG